MGVPALMLFGTHELVFDDKSRAVLPAVFRRKLREECAGELVLTQSLFDPCLWLYPRSVWEQLLCDLHRVSSLSHPAVLSMQRLLLGSAQDVRLDSQGRFAVSPELRRLAGLQDKNFFLLGLQQKFEIWAPAALSARQQQDRENISKAMLSLKDNELFANLRI